MKTEFELNLIRSALVLMGKCFENIFFLKNKKNLSVVGFYLRRPSNVANFLTPAPHPAQPPHPSSASQ